MFYSHRMSESFVVNSEFITPANKEEWPADEPLGEQTMASPACCFSACLVLCLSVSLSSCGSWTLSTVKPLWKTNRKTLCMRSLPKTDEGLWTQLNADANRTEAWRWRTFHNLWTDWFPIWDFFVSKCKNNNVIPSVLSSWEQCGLHHWITPLK